ncbi:MAG: ATP-binding cassette domain-containing protein [Candidatus Eisenbacteria bacterium]|nr:ATP-binding cassette domain-containing protein [Candidatus Eisenbacteria bacterium]
MDAVSIQGISKSFQSQKAVDRLSLDVPVGSIFGLLGPNGSGKTTTIRMILKILLPDEGTIRVLGSDLDDAGKRKVGYLPEERGLYRSMRVLDHLAFLGALHGLSLREARARGKRWLERFEVGDWANRRIQELSKGMQQKVQFIGTVLHEPELVILDEPFSGLDPVNVRLLKDAMLELRDRGCTVIFSTHQMEQVEKSCDRICLIHKGRAVVQGPLAEVRALHGDDTVQVEYSGDLPRDLLDSMEAEYRDHGRYVEIHLKRPDDAGALLRRLVERVEIRRFEVAEASLEEIFIRLVEGAR